MAWHSAKGFKPVSISGADRTSLPGEGQSVPHGSSVIIFTTAAIQQCRINSVRYCGPKSGRAGPARKGIQKRAKPLLNLSIYPRIRRFRPLVEFIALSPVHRAYTFDLLKIFVVRDFHWTERERESAEKVNLSVYHVM